MAKRPSKAVIFGMDAPMAPRLYKYAKEGKLPNFARLINNGVWGHNALVPFPTITPPNWVAIATGAWPSTNKVTCFNVHVPGEPLDLTYGGFYSGFNQSEFVWNAIARAGKRAVVVNYPGTWPPTQKDMIQIGGAGVEVNQWFYPTLLYGPDPPGSPPAVTGELAERYRKEFMARSRGVRAAAAAEGGDSPEPKKEGESERRGIAGPFAWASLSFERMFTVKPIGSGRRAPDLITLKEPAGWSNVPTAKKALESTLVYRPGAGRYQMSRPVWQMLVLDTKGEGYDKVLICESKDASRPMAELSEGQWSPIITRNFETEVGTKKAGFTLKLLKLSKDAEDIRIYHSALCALDGWGYPASLPAEITSEKGLPYPQSGSFAFDRNWFDADMIIEIGKLEQQWFSDAISYILKNKPWDLFMMHYHLPDHAWHSISWMMDPAIAKSEAEWRKYQEYELGIYKLCDQLAGDIFACADPDETVFALTSDHGAKATNGPGDNVNRILMDAGLLVLDSEGEIDWAKTKAIGQRRVYVYVNLKGRDPDGSVEPSDYRKVQDEIIKALTDYVEPTTGLKPIIMALRREDARSMNIYGEHAGDVVYAINELMGGQHGCFLPSAEWGLGSLHGVFAMSGPGVKKGFELERNIWNIDLVPTICYLNGWPMPANADGAVIYQALENPDPK